MSIIYYFFYRTFNIRSIVFDLQIPNNSPHKFCAKVFVKIENDRWNLNREI